MWISKLLFFLGGIIVAKKSDIFRKFSKKSKKVESDPNVSENLKSTKDDDDNSYFELYEEELKNKDNTIENMKNKMTELENALATSEHDKEILIKQSANSSQLAQVNRKIDDSLSSIKQLMKVAFDYNYLKNSLEIIANNSVLRDDVIRKFQSLPNAKSKKVRGTNHFKEIHLTEGFRLYYRTCDANKYQVLISHKTTQKIDIEWLKQHEKSVQKIR